MLMKQNEIKRLIEKRDALEIGTPEYMAYNDCIIALREVKLHIEEEALCEGCQ